MAGDHLAAAAPFVVASCLVGVLAEADLAWEDLA